MTRVLVDTCVWSIALRREHPHRGDIVQKLTGLIEDNTAFLIGPIRQELLSGYSDKRKFRELKLKLEPFPNLTIDDGDYLQAAEFANACRRGGVQGSHTDFLICAVACRNKMPVFTVDRDFERYARILPVALLK